MAEPPTRAALLSLAGDALSCRAAHRRARVLSRYRQVVFVVIGIAPASIKRNGAGAGQRTQGSGNIGAPALGSSGSPGNIARLQRGNIGLRPCGEAGLAHRSHEVREAGSAFREELVARCTQVSDAAAHAHDERIAIIARERALSGSGSAARRVALQERCSECVQLLRLELTPPDVKHGFRHSFALLFQNKKLQYVTARQAVTIGILTGARVKRRSAGRRTARGEANVHVCRFLIAGCSCC
jgi:hypothetical protein